MRPVIVPKLARLDAPWKQKFLYGGSFGTDF